MRKAPAWWRFFIERILGHAAFASCIGFFVFGFGFGFPFGEIPDFPLHPADSRVDPDGVFFCFAERPAAEGGAEPVMISRALGSLFPPLSHI